MPQDDLVKIMKKFKADYHTTSELSAMLSQSQPSIRRMIRKMLEQNELEIIKVTRGHQKNISAYKLKL